MLSQIKAPALEEFFFAMFPEEELTPQSDDKIYFEAESLLSQNKFDDVLRLYDFLISTAEMVNSEVYLARGTLHQCLGQHGKAVHDFTKVLSDEPLNTEALFRRGVSFRLLKFYEAAAEDFLTAREVEPGRAALSIDFNEMNRALFSQSQGAHFISMV